MRLAPVTKRVRGKVRRYKNLASFNSECLKRGTSGNLCTVTNYRFTRKAGCLATIKSEYPGGDENIKRRGAKPAGTWLLHFADCGVMRRHLQGRVSDKTRDAWLSGARRTRRRRKRPLTGEQIRAKLACKVFGGKACL